MSSDLWAISGGLRAVARSISESGSGGVSINTKGIERKMGDVSENIGKLAGNVENVSNSLDRGTDQIVDCLNRGIKIKQADGYHQMTRYEIRNYMNSHNVESINKETLFEFFGPNIYDTVEGCKHYFTHEICSCRYDISKICKALEAAFPFLNPNIGDLNYDENYFQTFMFNYMYLGCNKLDVDIQILLIEALLELGFQYGLDPQFKTLSEGNTMWHYLCLGIDNFKVLEHVFNSLKNKKVDSYYKNFYNYEFLFYILIKVTTVYSWGKEFYFYKKSSDLPIMYLHQLYQKKELYDITKKVDENIDSLKRNFQEAEREWEIRVKKISQDPLLSRFLDKNDLFRKRWSRVEGSDWDGGPPIDEIMYSLSYDFSLRGYETLYNFIEFYNRLCWDYNYNRDGVETVNALKRILKKEEKKDNKE